MQLSMQISYAGGYKESAQQLVRLEQAGLDIAWIAEAYSYDAPSYMGYLAALTERVQIGAGILPLYTRTPTLLAMTAAGIDALSDGRCILGLGASGPQVIEGFHGVPYDKPLARTREIVDICRQVWKREAPLTHDGPLYTIPLPTEQGTGLGKAAEDHQPPGAVRRSRSTSRRSARRTWSSPPRSPMVGCRSSSSPRRPARCSVPRSTPVPRIAIRRSVRWRSVRVGWWRSARSPRSRTSATSPGPPPRSTSAAWGAKGQNFYNALVQRYGYEAEAAADPGPLPVREEA